MAEHSQGQTSTLGPPTSLKKLNRWTLAIVLIGILIVGVLFSLIYFSNAVVTFKNFSYSPAKDSTGTYNSLSISDVDGLIIVQPWSQSSILINGTITAKGLGSSLSTVTITNSSRNGDVVFNADFPVSGGVLFSQTFSAAINVFVPSWIQFSNVQISNVNGGAQVQGLNSTIVSITTVNGRVLFDCIYCARVAVASTNGNVTGTFRNLVSQGSYNLTALNANISFSAPSSSSFTLTAKVLNGYIVCPICNTSQTNRTSLTETFGAGSASVDLSSTNGQIMITGI